MQKTYQQYCNDCMKNGYVMIENPMLEALYGTHLSGGEQKVFMAVVRKTIGWGKMKDKVALTQFEKLTGIKAKRIPALIKKLAEKKLITIYDAQKDPSEKGYYKINTYEINTNYSQWYRVPQLQKEDITHYPKMRPPVPKKWPKQAQKRDYSGPKWGVTTDTQNTYYTYNTTYSFKEDEEGKIKKGEGVKRSRGEEGKREREKPKEEKMKNREEVIGKKGEEEKKKDQSKTLKKTKNPINNLIKLAAGDYNLTITGHKVKILKELLEIWGSQEIEARLKVFAQYQQKPVKDRRYPLGNTFDAFARKFDLFKDSAMLEIRLAAEKRWDQEYRNQGVANAGAGKKQSDGCIRYETFNKSTDKDDDFDIIQWYSDSIINKEREIRGNEIWIERYQNIIDKSGKSPEKALAPNIYMKYQVFKRNAGPNKEELLEMQAKMAEEKKKKAGISHDHA